MTYMSSKCRCEILIFFRKDRKSHLDVQHIYIASFFVALEPLEPFLRAGGNTPLFDSIYFHSGVVLALSARVFICSWKGFLEVTGVSGLWRSSFQLSLHLKEMWGSVTPQPSQYWYSTKAVWAQPRSLICADSQCGTPARAGVTTHTTSTWNQMETRKTHTHTHTHTPKVNSYYTVEVGETGN